MQNSLLQTGTAVRARDKQKHCRRRLALDSQELTAVELLRQCITSGDQAGWCELIRRLQPLIASVIVKTLCRWSRPQPHLVDDLVQETYLKLCADNFKALRKVHFAHDRALFGFLKVVASNVVQDHFRNRCSQKRGGGKVEEDLEALTAGVPSREDFVERAQHAILLSRVQESLKRQLSDSHFVRNYAIFRLYFEDGFTAKAISRLPGIDLSEKGVESALLRLKSLLKAALGRQLPRPKAHSNTGPLEH